MERGIAEMDNMTALVSAFARAYHYRNSAERVFEDALAERMLTREEYDRISRHMTEGIAYFAPGFAGTREEALRWIVDHQLAPSVLARSAFCERAMDNAVRIGARQIVIYACGYDTFSLRTADPELAVFELDRPEMIEDRQARIARGGLRPVCRVASIGCDLSRPAWREALVGAGFDAGKPSFGSLLGISYYLSGDEYASLIGGIASLCCEGSSLCFDYPLTGGGAQSRRTRELAAAAGERMKAQYTYDEMEALLSKARFLIYEHMDADEATGAFFRAYNLRHPGCGMAAPAGVGYCLAVKQ